jgi:hypothetical protein
MKRYKKIYMQFFGICEEELVPCERCYKAVAVDIHHCSARGMGGDPQGKKDVIENLGGVCRSCHDVLEANPVDNEAFARWCADLVSRKNKMKAMLRR